jgi:hypothetical protein
MATTKRRDDRVQIHTLLVDQRLNATGLFQIDSTSLTVSGAELNLLDGLEATYAELNLLHDVTADGTVDVSKAVVTGPAGEIKGLGNIGQLAAGTWTFGTTEIVEADIIKIDGITAGTVLASRAVVVDANKDAASFRTITVAGTMIYGVAQSGGANITATPAEINLNDNQPASVVYKVTQAANAGTVNVGVQVNDAAGVNMGIPVALFQYLSDDSAALTPTTAGPNAGGGVMDGIAPSTGKWIHPAATLPAWTAVTTAAGTLTMPIKHSGAGTWYMATVLPNGKLSISGTITTA